MHVARRFEVEHEEEVMQFKLYMTALNAMKCIFKRAIDIWTATDDNLKYWLMQLNYSNFKAT